MQILSIPTVNDEATKLLRGLDRFADEYAGQSLLLLFLRPNLERLKDLCCTADPSDPMLLRAQGAAQAVIDMITLLSDARKMIERRNTAETRP